MRARHAGAPVFLTMSVGLGLLTSACTTPGQPVGSTCEALGSFRVQDGRYIVQNNRWGASTEQCIDVTSDGFTVTRASHNNATNGPPASYPSIFQGCHYGNCTTGPYPKVYSTLADVTSNVTLTVPASGEWDAAYDIWLDPTNRTDGQNTGAEIMVWVNHRGRPQPFGQKVGTAQLGGAAWDVWFGSQGWNTVSYVRQQPATSFAGSLKPFVDDAAGRGWVQRSWWLTSVQFGFEPWIGGAGLGVSGFTADAR
jgi:hypothetical protein